MCGFVALFEDGRVFARPLLQAMERDILHRGPDSGGIVSEAGRALILRRLAILDPAAKADQPMTDAAGRCTLIYNGEIYNFRRLGQELAEAGVRLRTTGDTEVILEGYLAWGEAVVERLEGMFAFVLLDRAENKVIAARDPFGIKPLYLMRKGPLTAFASEMRPLARLTPPAADPAALSELITFRFAAGRLSNIAGIEKLPGGTVATLDLADGHFSERRFADPLDSLAPEQHIGREEALAKAAEAIGNSVRDHLQSDVGYTVQLSGGVDSSLVAALAAEAADSPITTFGIKLDDGRFDESPYRNQVIERHGLRHHEVRLGGGDFADALPRAVRHMEGPVPHYGCVMLMLLCDRIRETSKVVLTGEGGDELFGGYKRYGLWRELRLKGRLARCVPNALWPWLQRYREIQRYAGRDPAVYGAVYHDFLALAALFPDLVPRPGAREAAAGRFADFRSRMFAADQTAYLESLLMRQDKMAMAASVEARVPFTHMPLARVVNRFPHALRAPGGDTKPLLKAIAEPHLPTEVIHRRKIGLNLPLDDWTADPNALGRYLDLLADPNARLATYAPAKRLAGAVDAFRRGRRVGLPPLPHLINLELWLRSLPPASAGATLAA
ncbi:MAG: asparagine synthase (glutamine-hydrolyzing) [Kiloniellales bacterium]